MTAPGANSRVGHTPGPWMAHPVHRWVVPVADPEMPVCLLRHETNGVRCPESEVRANADLIAAAPDLLEAAQTVLDGLNARIDAACAAGEPVPVFAGIAVLHSAIAKARGEQA